MLISEGGASWIPFLGDRMREGYRQHHTAVRPKLTRDPKDILMTQVYASFQHDESAVAAFDAMGYKNVMFGSDYPHMEGTYGHTQDTLKELFDGVSERPGSGSPRAPSPSCSRRCRRLPPTRPDRGAGTGLRDVAIAGIGATPYYKRGETAHMSINQLAGEAILAACADAGLSVTEVDGLAFYSLARAGYGDQLEAGEFVEMLGIRELNFTAALTGGGGGSAGAIGLARAAIVAGDASVVVTVMALQQRTRLGSVVASKAATPVSSFVQPSGLAGPGHLMSLLTRRHMHQYGTTRDAFAEIAISTRNNALNRPKARYREPLTREQYFGSRMIADPLCLYDFCLETEGAVAIVTTSLERARDLRQRPVPVVAAAHGGTREWGRGFSWFGMPDDETFASSGHQAVAGWLYPRPG